MLLDRLDQAGLGAHSASTNHVPVLARRPSVNPAIAMAYVDVDSGNSVFGPSAVDRDTVSCFDDRLADCIAAEWEAEAKRQTNMAGAAACTLAARIWRDRAYEIRYEYGQDHGREDCQ